MFSFCFLFSVCLIVCALLRAPLLLTVCSPRGETDALKPYAPAQVPVALRAGGMKDGGPEAPRRRDGERRRLRGGTLVRLIDTLWARWACRRQLDLVAATWQPR